MNSSIGQPIESKLLGPYNCRGCGATAAHGLFRDKNLSPPGGAAGSGRQALEQREWRGKSKTNWLSISSWGRKLWKDPHAKNS